MTSTNRAARGSRFAPLGGAPVTYDHDMAGDHSRYQEGVIRRYYEHKDTIALQRLSEIVSDLYLAEGGEAARLWKGARAALEKIAGDDPRTAKVLAAKDVQGLARLVGELSRNAGSAREAATAAGADPVIGQAPEQAPASSLTTPPVDPREAQARASRPVADGPPTPEQLKSAMKMFRKRLKLKKLDDESKLGRSPLSSGRKSATVAIMAPREFPPAVWEELTRQGKLRHAGGSFYELVEE
jgi:hypothetical protein